jgi:tetratricopeptide (TPR) repeat protein
VTLSSPPVSAANRPLPAKRLSPALVGALVALAAVLPLLPTLRAAFIYDDTTIIRDNPLLRGWDSLARVWSAPYWPTTGADVSGLYRPLHTAILAALWNAGDGAAWPFHVYALALHASVAVAVWWMLRRGVGALAAAVGALWFATHPLHVEAVASASNSAELLVVGCTIALTWLLRRASDDGAGHGAGREWRIALGAAGLTAAAVLSKESGLLALPIAALTAWGWRASETTRLADSVRGRRRLWLAAGAALAVALMARAVVLGALVARVSIAAPGLDVLSPVQRIVAMLSLWPRVAQMIVWPGPLAPYYGPTILPANRGALATLAVLSSLAVATLVLVLARRGDKRPLIALAWGALAYLPASNLLTATGQLLADRTLFGATVGAAMALAWAVDRLPRRARVALLLVAALAIGRNALESARYAVTWSSHRALWEHLVEVSPTEPRGYQLLGIDARERGDTARALPLLARAFAMEPRARRNRFEYGQVLYATGRHAQAAQVLAPLLANDDVRREPQFVAMYLDAVGRAHGAEAVVSEGAPLLRSESGPTVALYVGAAHEQLGRLAAADSVYGVGLRAAPRDSLLLARRASVERRLAPR